MNDTSSTSARGRRIRGALLASVFTLGVAGATGAGALFGDHNEALAEQVRVESPAPADFTGVVEQVKQAVVSVRVQTEIDPVADNGFYNFRGFENLPEDNPLNEFFKRFGAPDGSGRETPPQHPRERMSQGSGFFISDDGYLVTNNHVVEHGKDLVVIMDDGRELSAEVIGSDERTDLALLKVEGSGFKYVSFAHSDPKIGQWAIAVGNPFGLGGSVTAGIVSAEGRDIGAGPYDDFIQIDTPVNRGNSGGPTFNTSGEVIGVNTAIFSPSGGNVGIAFAIPASVVESVVQDLRDDGTVTRGWLGVQIQPVTPDIAESLGIDEDTKGALVSDPQANGPAVKAGIQAGDIITEVDGRTVSDPRDLARLIAGYDPDSKVIVTVLRDGEEMPLDVTLGSLDQMAAATAQDEDSAPAAEQSGFDSFGLTLQPNEDGEGLVVAGVEQDSPAAEKGIEAGDVILAVGNTDVSSVSDMEDAAAAAKEEGRKAVLLRVENDRGSRFVALPFDRG